MKLKNKIKTSQRIWLRLGLLAILSVAMLFTTLYGETKLFIIVSILFFVNFFFFILKTCSNGKEGFNKDSFRIFFAYFVPLFLVLSAELSVQLLTGELFYGIVATVLIIFWSQLAWINYFVICIKVITDIKQDKLLFMVKAIRSILTALLVFGSGTIVILSLFADDKDIQVSYQVFNILINSTYPVIDMFTYVRSELDKY